MKRILIIAFACLLAWPCFSNKIHVMRFTRSAQKNRMVVFTPLAADYAESAKTLSLQFYERMGTIFITVTDASGSVAFSDLLDYKADSATLDLQSLPTGSYTLTVTCGTTYLTEYSGTFEVE